VTSICVGAAAALFVVLLAPWLSRTILDAAGLSTALSLGAVAMFFAALNGSQVGALSGLEAFQRVALGNLVRGTGLILFVTAGALQSGINGALLGYIAAGAATAIYYQMALGRACASNAIAISYRFTRKDFAILWRFTLPVLLTTLSFTPAAWWTNVLLASRNGYAEVGIFNAVFHWQMLIVFFSTAMSNIGLPMLSNIRAERDPAKYKRCLAISFLLTSVPAIAIAVPVAIFSPLIVRLYGPAFEHGATALALISFAAVLSAINIPVGQAIWSLDAIVPAVLLALLRGGVLVAASYALAAKGASGIAAAYVIMGLIQTAATVPFMIFILRRKLAPETSPIGVPLV
jgi:O-antigen/teichoic acid export membrane protein